MSKKGDNSGEAKKAPAAAAAAAAGSEHSPKAAAAKGRPAAPSGGAKAKVRAAQPGNRSTELFAHLPQFKVGMLCSASPALLTAHPRPRCTS